jgi:hypothetical protein
LDIHKATSKENCGKRDIMLEKNSIVAEDMQACIAGEKGIALPGGI